MWVFYVHQLHLKNFALTCTVWCFEFIKSRSCGGLCGKQPPNKPSLNKGGSGVEWHHYVVTDLKVVATR